MILDSMGRYFSIDTEATGLEEDSYLIQFAIVPVSASDKKVYEQLGREVWVRCPSFEELKPKLNAWVLEHNESLIRTAHEKGISPYEFAKWMSQYLSSSDIQEFSKGERLPLLGKSLSALDVPLLTRYLGKPYMEKHFHHHTIDVTSIARFLVDSKHFPSDTASTSKLLPHLGIRSIPSHTALSDAVDMGNAYLRMVEKLLR